MGGGAVRVRFQHLIHHGLRFSEFACFGGQINLVYGRFSRERSARRARALASRVIRAKDFAVMSDLQSGTGPKWG
jgi:hypothetical protein